MCGREVWLFEMITVWISHLFLLSLCGFREIKWMVVEHRDNDFVVCNISTKSHYIFHETSMEFFCANRLVNGLYFNYKIPLNLCDSSTLWRFLIVSCIGEIFIFYSSLFLSFAEGFITVELNWLDWFLMILLYLFSISVLSPFLDYVFLMVGINYCSSESSSSII